MTTTNVKLIKIIPNAIYENKVWDYFAIFELINGQVIQIFDDECKSESMKIGLKYNILIRAIFLNETINFELNTFKISKIKSQDLHKYFQNDFISIQVKNEDVLVQDINLNINNILSFGSLRMTSVQED